MCACATSNRITDCCFYFIRTCFLRRKQTSDDSQQLKPTNKQKKTPNWLDNNRIFLSPSLARSFIVTLHCLLFILGMQLFTDRQLFTDLKIFSEACVRINPNYKRIHKSMPSGTTFATKITVPHLLKQRYFLKLLQYFVLMASKCSNIC